MGEVGAFAPRFEEDDSDYTDSEIEQLIAVAHTHDNKLFLDRLTKDYITQLAGGTYYKKSFTTDDWVQISQYIGVYKLTIPQSEHGMTKPYLDVFFAETTDGTLKEALPATQLIYPNILSIKTAYPSNGFLIIKDKEN